MIILPWCFFSTRALIRKSIGVARLQWRPIRTPLFASVNIVCKLYFRDLVTETPKPTDERLHSVDQHNTLNNVWPLLHDRTPLPAGNPRRSAAPSTEVHGDVQSDLKGRSLPTPTSRHLFQPSLSHDTQQLADRLRVTKAMADLERKRWEWQLEAEKVGRVLYGANQQDWPLWLRAAKMV